MKRPAAAAAVLMTLTACAGSGDGAADSAKAAYVRDASAVCTQASAKVDALGTPSDAAGLAAAVDAVVAAGEQARDELAALTPPPADAQMLRSKVLEPFGQLVTQGRAFADKVQAAGSDSGALLPLLSQRPKGEGIDVEYLRGYGLTSCADLVTRLREG